MKEKLDELKRRSQVDAEIAAFQAVNDNRLYPFRKQEFIEGFVTGRMSLIAALEEADRCKNSRTSAILPPD